MHTLRTHRQIFPNVSLTVVTIPSPLSKQGVNQKILYPLQEDNLPHESGYQIQYRDPHGKLGTWEAFLDVYVHLGREIPVLVVDLPPAPFDHSGVYQVFNAWNPSRFNIFVYPDMFDDTPRDTSQNVQASIKSVDCFIPDKGASHDIKAKSVLAQADPGDRDISGIFIPD